MISHNLLQLSGTIYQLILLSGVILAIFLFIATLMNKVEEDVRSALSIAAGLILFTSLLLDKEYIKFIIALFVLLTLIYTAIERH